MKTLLKKTVGVVAAVALAAGIFTMQTPQVAFAAAEWQEPSVRAWTGSLADASGNSIFNLKASKEGGNYKKLQFGKYDGKPVNWYIANATEGSADLLAYSLQNGTKEENIQKPLGVSAFHDGGTKHNLTDNLGGTNLQ